MFPTLLDETHVFERIEAAMIDARRLRRSLEASGHEEDRRVLRQQLQEVERRIASLRHHLGRGRQAS